MKNRYGKIIEAEIFLENYINSLKKVTVEMCNRMMGIDNKCKGCM